MILGRLDSHPNGNTNQGHRSRSASIASRTTGQVNPTVSSEGWKRYLPGWMKKRNYEITTDLTNLNPDLTPDSKQVPTISNTSLQEIPQ